MAKAWHRNLDFSKYKQSKRETFPVIYITGQRTYGGILTDEDASEENVWAEIIKHNCIKHVLNQWQKRVTNNNNIDNIIPFRMVLHKTHKMKLSYDYGLQNRMQCSSDCKHFALIWIPCNIENGMNANEYDEFIAALVESKYFCNKLNKECIYISGPNYGNDEVRGSSNYHNDEHKFNLVSLYNCCQAFSASDIPQEKMLDIQIVVHELDRQQLNKEEQDKFEFDIFKNGPSFRKLPSASIPYLPPNGPNLSILSDPNMVDISQRSLFSALIPNSIPLIPSKLSYDGIPSTQFQIQSLSFSKTVDQLDAEQSPTRRERHAFAFVWFKVKDKEEIDNDINDDNKEQQQQPSFIHNKGSHKKLRKTSISNSNDLQRALMDDDEDDDDHHDDIERKSFEMHRIDKDDANFDGVLPALSVMYRLHQQPCGDSRAGLFNVELMGYDECYQNLKLTVDTYRSGSWKDSFIVLTLLVILQCLFLPFFVLIPPIYIIKLFNPKFKVTPRYRPGGALSDPFEDLDRTEQIPYDINAIWRSYRFDKQLIDRKKSLCKRFRRKCKNKFRAFLLSIYFWSVVFGGPILYDYKRTTGVKHLSFFDCFGPMIFYGLGVCTIICWSCICRGLIGPKEHLLLYNKIIAQRPAKKKKPTTDFAALTYLSQHSMITAFSYAQRKGFLEVRTPTHELISKRVFGCRGKSKSKNFKTWILFTTSIIIYFGAQNLENFQKKHRPFYVDNDNIEISHYYLRQIYCIISNITSWIMLWCFIVLWETMIDRIRRQHGNVGNITNLIVRNTYSEYIQFDYTDNILSWLTLGDFIKRKGMMLFASLETPVFSLFLLALLSWSGTIFCIFGGVGLKWKTNNSLFSNSALATWFFLAILSILQVARLLWYGHKFNRESEKQNNAIRTQCSTIHNDNLMQFLKHDKLSLEQKYAIQSSQILLTHLKDHNEIVPKVFGIKFDKLTAKAAWTAIISAFPTIIGFLIAKINE